MKMVMAMLLAFISMPLFADDYDVIKGKVWDAAYDIPMVGVNISEKGTTNGVISDINGNFEIKVHKKAILLFQFLGYQDISIEVNSDTDFSKIMMSPDTEQLDEIVVVGYGQQKKVSSVGAIGTAKGTDLLSAGNVTSISEALQGQIAGVLAVNTTSKPGADAAELFIRGKATWQSAQPLILVDGIERDFNDVDVNEIESISVLKDASATAVYGVKGGNGVILLTTKRGKEGKIKLNFSANFGFKQPTTKYEWADYVTSMKMYNEAVANDMLWEKIIPESTIKAWENAYATGNYGPYNDYFPQIDWWDELVKDCGYQQNYNLNVSGGSKRISYFASFGFLNDGDIYAIEKQKDFDPRFFYKRYNWRANFDFNITKTTKLSINISGKVGYRNQPGYRNASEGDRWIFKPFFEVSANAFPIKYSDGNWGCDSLGEGHVLAQMNLQGQRSYKTFEGFYDFVLTQKLDMITKGLSFKAAASYSSKIAEQNNIIKAEVLGANGPESEKNSIIRYYREYDYTSPIFSDTGEIIGYNLKFEQRFPDWQAEDNYPVGVSYENFNSYSRDLYYEFSLNYNRSFKSHIVSVLALFNRRILDSTSGSTLQFSCYEEDWVGRLTYNWKERYLLEINASYTGSEKFAPGKRFGFFPSFSVGWRLSEEPFMEKIRNSWLSNLKIRYSYGKVGSDSGAPRFNYIQIFNSGGNVTFGMDQNISYGPLYTEGRLAYENATWETAVKQNLGVDITLFKKLSLAVDLFDEHRSGILMPRNTIAPWMGQGLPSMNLGKTKNHGLEIDMQWNDIIGKDFQYYLKFNYSTSENRMVFRDDPKNLEEYMKKAGKPIGYQSKYLVAGNLTSIDDIFNYTTTNLENGQKSSLVPGDFMYIDYNSDGVIDDKDKAPVSELNYPLTTYGFTLGFSWKGIGFNAMFYAATNYSREQIPQLLWDFPVGNIKAQPNAQERWTVTSAKNEIVRPSLHLINDYNSVSSTFSFVDYSYVRLKNLEINYSLPQKWIKNAKLSNCQFYINGNNLFTWTKVDKRVDPETQSNSVYPIVKRYNLGVRLSF